MQELELALAYLAIKRFCLPVIGYIGKESVVKGAIIKRDVIEAVDKVFKQIYS